MNELEPPEIWSHEMRRLHRRISQLENQKDLVVLYGSSSIRLWVNAKEDLAPLNVINLGFGGSSYRWCAYYFDELFESVNPARMVLYAGENDLSNGLTESEVMNDLNVLVTKIREKYGEIPLFILTIKPSPDRTYLTDKILSLNRSLRDYCEQLNHTKLIDIYHAMLDSQENVQPHLYLSDGLHMNKEGYKIWRSVLKSRL